MMIWYKFLTLFGYQEYYKLGGSIRSPHWREVRNKFIRENPLCSVCGKKGTFLKPNEVHHCEPFHFKPELELSYANLITFCREHHLLIGHLMSWKSFNKDVKIDSEILKIK